MIVKVKKTVVYLMILFMLVFVSGCGDSETVSGQKTIDAADLYNTISKRVDELSSIKAQLTTTILVNNSMESLQLNMVSDIKQIGNSIVGAEVEMISSTRYLDKTVSVASYYKEGYYYTDYGGEKIKLKLSNEDMMSENHLSLPKIDEEYIKESDVEFDAQEKATVTLLVESDIFFDMAEELGISFIDEDTEFFNCSDMTMVIKLGEDREIESCNYLITVNVTEGGALTEYTIDVYIEYMSVNEPIEIQFPDFSEYKEVYSE